MAYVASTPSRMGQDKLDGATDALFLKVFSGEIITVFDETNVMLPTTTVRTITSGKSAQFPAVGTANASYHVAGQDILSDDGGTPEYLSQIAGGERVVVINNLLLSSVFIDSLDEAKSHFDVRGEYSKQMARALAAEADKTLLHHGIIGARLTGGTADRFGGGTYLGSTVDLDVASAAAVTSAKLIDGAFAAAEYFDTKDVPADDRYIVMTPDAYYKLIATDGTAGGLILNRDFGNDGNGSMASGTVGSVAGFKILKSNHIPSADVDMAGAAKAGDNSSLSGTLDFTGTNAAHPVALCYHKSALGTVKLRDLKVEAERRIERQGHLIVAGYAMGHEVLRHECLFELAY